MKKTITKIVIYALLICLLALPLASCNDEAASPDVPNQTTTTVTTATTADEGDPLPPSAPNYESMPYVSAADVGEILICGVDIEEYRIVIPQNCDLYTQYAAQNFADYLESNAGITISIVNDSNSETEYEIVIGNTNRLASERAAAVSLKANEYIAMLDGNDLIFYGNSYMVGGGAGDFLSRHCLGAWKGCDIDIKDLPTEPIPETFVFQTARNAVLLIGDGMGREQVNMTLANGLGHFSADDMPSRGMIITQSQSVIDGKADYTDSAAAGTALATGHKTLNEHVGVDKDGVPLQNIREFAHSKGAKTAILTTDVITGATPGAFLAHVNDRDETEAINAAVSALLAEGKVDYAVGSLKNDNFLSTSAKALQSISANGSSFFAMIEEGYIDKYSHNNNAASVIDTVKRFDHVIAYGMEFALFHPDTVIIVTADHETGGLIHDGGSYRFTSGSHTNVDVPIYAMGTDTDYFDQATLDNTLVASFIKDIYA